MDPLWIFLIMVRLFIGTLIIITYLIMPTLIRLLMLGAIVFFVYHWRVYHQPFALHHRGREYAIQ